MIRFTWILIFTMTISAFCGCNQSSETQPIQSGSKAIKIGVIGPFSGPHFAKGENGLKGIRAVMALKPSLKNGNPVELVVEDDQNDPALLLNALEKLTRKDNVTAILIFSTSTSVLRIAPIADSFRTPILAVLATHPDIPSQSSYISQLCFDDYFQGMVASLFVRDELLIGNVAVFKNIENSHSCFLSDRFENKFKSIGGQITASVELNSETKDYADILEDIRNKDTELLYLPVEAENFLKIVQALNRIKWKPKLMGSDGLSATVLSNDKKSLNLLEGVMVTDFFSDGMPLTPFGEKVLKKYRSLYNSPANSYTALGAEGYALLLDVTNRCDAADARECINRKIRSTANFTGITGKITIYPDGMANRPLAVNVIRNGAMKFIVKVY